MSSKTGFCKSELRLAYLILSSSLDTTEGEVDLQRVVHMFLKYESQNTEWKFLLKLFYRSPIDLDLCIRSGVTVEG